MQIKLTYQLKKHIYQMPTMCQGALKGLKITMVNKTCLTLKKLIQCHCCCYCILLAIFPHI